MPRPFLLIIVAFLTTLARADDYPVVTPEELGFDYEIERSPLSDLTQTFRDRQTGGRVSVTTNAFGDPVETPAPKVCGGDVAPSAEALLAKLSQLFGKNAASDRLGLAKAELTGCASAPGGNARVLKEAQEAVNVGIGCLANRGSPATRLEAARLLAIFQNPQLTLRFACRKLPEGTLAESKHPPDAPSPSLALDPAKLAPLETSERRGLVFHEMVHWLGIRHDHAFDTPYLADTCCFGSASAEAAELACGLLAQDPRPALESADYLARFAELAQRIYRPYIAHDLLRKLIDDSWKTKRPALRAGVPAALRKLIELGDPMGVVFGSLLQGLDPKGAGKLEYGPLDTQKADLAKQTGELAALMYQPTTEYAAFATRIKKLEAAVTRYFAALPADQRAADAEEVAGWLDLFTLRSFDVKHAGSVTAPDLLWKKLQDQVNRQIK